LLLSIIRNGLISLYIIKELLLSIKWSIIPELIYQIFVKLLLYNYLLKRVLIIDFIVLYILGYISALGSEDAFLLLELVSFPLEL
jgi:hypothetical protein